MRCDGCGGDGKRIDEQVERESLQEMRAQGGLSPVYYRGMIEETCLKKDSISGKKEALKKYLSIAAAFVISGFLLYFGYNSLESETAQQPYRIVALGDSIIGKERDSSCVQARLEEYTGGSVLSGAFGGNLASRGEHSDSFSWHEESLNLYAVAEAVCQRDFGVQKADLAASQTKAWYFEDVLEGLEGADLGQTDILLLEFGVNDYMAGKALDNPEDPLDVNTYGGALRYSIELFEKTYPDLEIVLVTPAFCHVVDHGFCTEADFGGGTLEKYVEQEKKVAAQYGLRVIDVFYEFGMDETNVMDLTEDGMHLSPEGRKDYAHFLSEKLGLI